MLIGKVRSFKILAARDPLFTLYSICFFWRMAIAGMEDFKYDKVFVQRGDSIFQGWDI